MLTQLFPNADIYLVKQLRVIINELNYSFVQVVVL